MKDLVYMFSIESMSLARFSAQNKAEDEAGCRREDDNAYAQKRRRERVNPMKNSIIPHSPRPAAADLLGLR
jgi:hypothetical protein